MARYKDAVCRLCRREGTKLFLKGDRCFSAKCGIEKRAYPPGQHGQGRARFSDFGVQLREKQKVKRMYGLTEGQFRNLFESVTRESGVKGTNLLIALESRLDNIVYRMGFASSRKAARQLVNHGHVEVNGRRVDIASYHVIPGQEVRVAPTSREMVAVKAAQEYASRGAPVSWLSVDGDKAAGRYVERPTREAIPVNAQEQLIVELYSK